MRWNYDTNLPYEGSYRRYPHDPVKAWKIVSENLLFIDESIIPLLESVNYNPDEFLLKKLYKKIPQVSFDKYRFLLMFQFEEKPFLEDYYYDMGYGQWDIFFSRPYGFSWSYNEEPIEDMDIITRLYFSDSEYDIWDMVYDLPGYAVKNLYQLYEGDKPFSDAPSYLTQKGKAKEMMDYLCFKDDSKRGKFTLKDLAIFIDNSFVAGQVALVNENRLIIRLNKPIECFTSCRITEKLRKKTKYMTRDIEGNRQLTCAGEKEALKVLLETYQDEKSLLKSKNRLHEMLDDFHKREKERIEKWRFIDSGKQPRLLDNTFTTDDLLEEIQYEYFPKLRRISIDTEFVDKLEKYIGYGINT